MAEAVDLARGPLRPHHHQAVGLGIGEGLEENRVDDAHQGDGRVDADGENEDDDEGERGRLGERT